MAQPLYKKFGSDKAVDFSSMIAGQKAVGDSFKEAIGGVEGLLNTVTEKHKETNTLNMQEYLQKKIRQDGLGSTEPIDTIAIKRQFGDMVDMDALGETYAQEKTKLKKEAIDDAYTIGSQLYDESGGDLIKASKAFEDTLKNKYRADHDLINEGLANFRVAFETKEDDEATLKAQKLNEGSNQIYEALRAGEDPNVAITAFVNDLPKHEQAAVRKRYMDEVNVWSEIPKVTQNQIQNLISIRSAQANEAITLAELEYQDLVQQSQQFKQQATKPSESSYKLASQIITDTEDSPLGKSPEAVVSKQYNNWLQNLFGAESKNSAQYTALYDDLRNSGVSRDDAAAILIEVASDGNDFSENTIALANQYVQGVQGSQQLTEQISQAQKNLAKAKRTAEEDLATYRLTLEKTAIQNKFSETQKDLAKVGLNNIKSAVSQPTTTQQETTPVPEPTVETDEERIARINAAAGLDGSPPPAGKDTPTPPVSTTRETAVNKLTSRLNNPTSPRGVAYNPSVTNKENLDVNPAKSFREALQENSMKEAEQGAELWMNSWNRRGLSIEEKRKEIEKLKNKRGTAAIAEVLSKIIESESE